MRSQRTEPQRVRLLFGNEPFPSQRDRFTLRPGRLDAEIRDYWLSRGISVARCADVLRARQFVEDGPVGVRIAGPKKAIHAKIYVGDDSASLGSSNFTDAGFSRQSEANVRFERSEKRRFEDARTLAEGLWTAGIDYREGFIALLDELLRAVSWQEALARACATILEGEWAKQYVPPDDIERLDPPLWPHQLQGLSQALWILENVGSVLVSDATGSGKTRMGAWLIRGAYDRQYRFGHGRRSAPVIVVPPPLVEKWEEDLAETGLPLQVHSHGPLSNPGARKHKQLVEAITSTELLAVDEAHNFLNASDRTRRLLTHYADYAVLFTATPINRGADDLIAMIDLLGADNLPDEALEVFGRLRKRLRGGTRDEPDEELTLIKREIERFMVRRTRADLNRIADARPEEYRLATGRQARYPHHVANYYDCPGSEDDLAIADRITVLASQLKGVARIPGPVEMSRSLAVQGMTEEQYLKMIVNAARALAAHLVLDCLRSSRAALYEHVQGTQAALQTFRVDASESKKDPTGNVLETIAQQRGKLPEWKFESVTKDKAPPWLVDEAAHCAASDEDTRTYKEIAEAVTRMSDRRERAKIEHLIDLTERKGLVLAFDSHLISLEVFSDDLKRRNAPVSLFTGQGGSEVKRQAQRRLGLEAGEERLVALCSDAMSEGLNLQGASIVVHLDTPTVIRTAEQRAGRVDRMDSRHDEVQIWWPRDPPSFAPRRGDLLRERNEVVSDLIGANLQLPDEDAPLAVEELAKQTNVDREDPADFYDAFRPIHSLIGPNGLVSEPLYNSMRTSQADVVSGVSIVASQRAWAFLAVAGLARSAPRWVFLDGLEAQPVTDLAAVADLLRQNLRDDPPDVLPTDPRAADLVARFVKRLESVEHLLLPMRRQRALNLADRTFESWRERAWREADEPRKLLMQGLKTLVRPDTSAAHPDLATVAEVWIRLVRPYQQEVLKHRRKGRKPWTLNDLEVPLRDQPIASEQLQRAFQELPIVATVGERVVAMIVGVPE